MAAMRATPQSTIDAIVYCVRVRGIAALEEPNNKERLARCDAAAREQIDERIRIMFQRGLVPCDANQPKTKTEY
jgi:hypothetical protein